MTWTQLNNYAGNSLDFVDANHGWVMNAGGSGYCTIGGGAIWLQFILPNQGFTPITSKIDFVNTTVGWVVGWYGYAAHTTDGGITWQLQTIATQDHVILGLHVLSVTEAFVVGRRRAGSPSEYHTTDAGATWTKSPPPDQYFMSNISATPSGNVWSSGFDGAVLHLGGAATPDTVTVISAIYTTARKQLQVPASTSATSATLQAFVTSTDTLIVTLTNKGTRYTGKFSWSVNPVSITVKSSAGGCCLRGYRSG